MKNVFLSALMAVVLMSWAITMDSAAQAAQHIKEKKPMTHSDGAYQTATFAGGCFWCVEADFEGLSRISVETSP